MALQCRKQVGVDCIRFVCSVADELYGYERGPLITLPPDQAMHDRYGAIAAMRQIRRRYFPVDDVRRDEFLEPGDILVTGPLNGGPGHAMIVGTAPGHIWETTMDGVQRSGMPFFGRDSELFRIYRVRDKAKWQ